MKPLSSVLGAALFALVMSAPAMAQNSMVPWATGLPNQSAFNHWAKIHQKAAAELQSNPGLAFNHAWRKRHPHFQHFIEKHPKDWAALKSNAARSYSPSFNSYLAGNPSAAEQLRQNPELLYNRAFRKAHPGLANYMQHHPNVWQATSVTAPPATATDESPAEEAAEHHHGWQHRHHGYWQHHPGDYWEHHETIERHWRENGQMRGAHWEKWHQAHARHDGD